MEREKYGKKHILLLCVFCEHAPHYQYRKVSVPRSSVLGGAKYVCFVACTYFACEIKPRTQCGEKYKMRKVWNRNMHRVKNARVS